MLSSSRKRSRSPSSGESTVKDPMMKTESNTQRLHEITAQTGELVKALSTVNDTVLRDLLQRWRGAQHQTISTRQQLLETERRLLAAQRGRVSTELRALQHEETDTCRTHVVEMLSAQLQTCGSQVVHTLSECMANSTRKALAAVQDRVQSGKSVNVALIEHVREFITTAFGALEDHTQRALRAELQSVAKDVTITRLQSALSLASAREARHADEIDALLRVVATLAEKSTHVREATEQLGRAKAHVTALERQLDLNGIVAAVAPAESLIPRRKAAAATSSSSAPAPAAPPAALAKTAPEYFAVRMMAHMDITLSELVQRWRDQENTIIQWQNKYHDLEASVYHLRRDALIAHQTLLEEQQRRSIAERRVTEMVRERLMPNEEAAAVKELTQLRWSYTQAVDDAAQLAVSLAASRDALAESQAASAALQQRLLQVEKDAAVDEVAAALLRMRSYYEGALQSVQNDLTDAEVQRRLLSTTVKTCQGVITEAHSALKSSQNNSNELSLEVERHLAAARDVQSAAHRTGLTQLEDVRMAVTGEAERVESRRAQLEKQHTIISSLQEQAVRQYESQLMTLVNTLEDPLLRDGSDVQQLQKPLDVGAYTQDVLSTKQAAEHLATMRVVMLEALQFVEEHLRTTGIERANLLDASVSDAEHMTVILANLKEVTAQRDKARTELQACHALIQANHLTVVERALSHEVSVPDSLDAAEAAERVGLLQAQQAASQQAYDRATEEHRATVVHAAELQESLTEVRRRDAMQQQQQQALRLALEASQSREQKLAESLASLQRRVETLVETSTASNNEAPVATSDPEAALHSLTAVLESMKGTMEALDIQIRTADPAGSGDANVAAESYVLTDSVAKRLESGGMRQLVPLLRETLTQAGLLQHAMHDYSLQTSVSLTDCAKAVGKESTLCTAEMLAVAEAQARSSALEATLKAERTAMQQRLEAAEAATRKADETNQRVLNISKGLMEKQAWLVGEVRRLRTELVEKEGLLKTLLPAQPPAPLEALEEVQSAMAEPAASVAPSLTDGSEEDLAAAPQPLVDNEDEVGATSVAADPTDAEVVCASADEDEVGGTADAAVDPSIGGATTHPPADADVPAASVEHEETLER